MNQRHSDFLGFVELAAGIDKDDRVWSLESRFRELANSGFFVDWINQQLSTLGPKAENAGLWFLPQIEVVSLANGVTISLRRYAKPRPLRSCHEAAIVLPLGTRPLLCDVYLLPQHDNSVFTPSVSLTKAGSHRIEPGVVFRAEAGMVYDFYSTERPVVAAVLALKLQTPLIWSFDRTSLKATGAGDADVIDAQLRAAIEVLGLIKDPSSLPLLQSLAQHEHHTVRWSAIQSAGRMSAAAARPLLEKALQDPHPHLRAAAAKTLSQLSSGQS